jgi:peptidyl-prolyl cis-trans isomerase D
MFEALRKMILPIIIIVLVFFSAMIVLEWGMGMSGRSSYEQSNIAAVINGEEVPWQVFNRLYNNLVRAESETTDDELPDNKLQELQEKAWQQLLSDRLLMQQVASHTIVVTDEEVYAYLKFSPPADIQQLSYFQTEGKFDYQKYMGALADPQMSRYWASVEPLVRSDLMKMKMQEMVIQNAHVTEAEVKDIFTTASERIKVDMINVGFDRFSRPPPQITEEEKQAFYEERRDQYTVDERAAVTMVLLEKNPAPYDWEVTYGRAMLVHDSLMAGADFAELAREFSEDPGSAVNGGDLDWFPRGQMVEEFDRFAFSMKEGDISEPFRSQHGWHIIKHHGYKEAPFIRRGGKGDEPVQQAHCSHILIKTTASQETLDLLYSRLEEFRSAALSSGFHKAALDTKMRLRESGLFFRDRNIQVLGRDIPASDFAFENEVGEISGIMENNSAVYVLLVADRQPEGPASYEDAKNKIDLDILTYKVNSLCLDTANVIYAEIQTGTDFKKAAEKYGEEVETPDEFRRNSYVKGFGQDPEAIGRAFSLSEVGQITKPVEYNQGVVIFRLIERIPPDLTEYAVRRDSIHNEILVRKQQMLFGGWFQSLIDESEIVNNIKRNRSRSDLM